MKLYRASQMRAADRAAAERGMPTLLLMEAAGRAVADVILERCASAQRILVLCGKGHNGGDGYVAARYLHGRGKAVRVLEIDPSPGAGNPATARAALLAHGLAPRPLLSDPDHPSTSAFEDELRWADLVVDALFGSGLARPVRGDLAEVLSRVNQADVVRVAVDVPSGVQVDDPAAPGPHLRADLTVQFAGPKLASAFYPARSAYGVSVVADIGIPHDVLASSSPLLLLDPDLVRAWLPRRAPDAHKYQVGTVLVVAGSVAYAGAAELACRAAYRGGSGLVTLAAADRAPAGWPEVVLQATDWGADAPLAWLADLDRKRAATSVIGPGLDPRALEHLPTMLATLTGPVVLDAAALVPGDALRDATRAHRDCVLTPHIGEAARLLGSDTATVSANPLESADALARAYGAVVVLKAATTVIAAPDGRVAVSIEGDPGMAVGGTGDVLAGLLGALLRSDSLFERACLGTFAHGRAGEQAARRHGMGLTANDLVKALPSVLAGLA